MSLKSNPTRKYIIYKRNIYTKKKFKAYKPPEDWLNNTLLEPFTINYEFVHIGKDVVYKRNIQSRKN